MSNGYIAIILHIKQIKKKAHLNFFTQWSGVKMFKCEVGFSKLHDSAKERRQKNVFIIKN